MIIMGKRLKDFTFSLIKALNGRISLGLTMFENEGRVFTLGLGDEFDSCSDVATFSGNVFDKDSSNI